MVKIKEIFLAILMSFFYLLLSLFFRVSALFLDFIITVAFTGVSSNFAGVISFCVAFASVLLSGILTTFFVSVIGFLSPIKPKFQKEKLVLFLVMFLIVSVTTSVMMFDLKTLLFVLLLDFLSVGGTLYIINKYKNLFFNKLIFS